MLNTIMFYFRDKYHELATSVSSSEKEMLMWLWYECRNITMEAEELDMDLMGGK